MICENISYNDKILIYLLHKGIGTEYVNESFNFQEKPDWNAICETSADQGVLALVYDGLTGLIKKGIIPEEFKPSRKLTLQWACNVMEIEHVYDKQYKLSNELADIYAEHNIKTVVLKGIAAAQFYPQPNHRPCGDLDCFLLGGYARGNDIAKELGACVDENERSLHSRIYYKGFMIENHKTFIDILTKKHAHFESVLENTLKNGDLESINNTNLLSPCALFNALFLTVHAWKHFKNLENVKLRQICDWALFLNIYINSIDWIEYKKLLSIIDKRILRFAESFSLISYKYLGSPLPEIFKESEDSLVLSEKVLKSILYDKEPVITHNYMKAKIEMFKRSLFGNWKDREFSEAAFLSNRINRTYKLLFSFFKRHI